MALDIMQLFYNHCTISGIYKEVGGDGVSGERGWAARGRSYLLLEHIYVVPLINKTDRIQRINRDNCWQQFNTTHVVIKAIHWLHRPCNALWCFDRASKVPSMKADLAIYYHMFGVFRYIRSAGV